MRGADDKRVGRGSQLLIAHMRSLDPDEPTARDRLEETLGERLVREVLLALRPEARPEAESDT